jgi:hypothetical protein
MEYDLNSDSLTKLGWVKSEDYIVDNIVFMSISTKTDMRSNKRKKERLYKE